ncbi:hypothetical protein LPJ62_005299 [Coemansia sp. RSA 2167]|nr:hypothetical protein LPJ62_005299 [Coemansia sp. RSA 2167]
MDDTTSSDGAADAAPFLERLDYSYRQTQEFAARCDVSIAEARLTRERMEEVIVQQQELIALLRAQQVTQPGREKEPSFKVLDRCVPELTDDPKAVEHWIQSAKEAIADMPAGVAVRALQDKLVGPQVHQLAWIPYARPQALFGELISVLGPDAARKTLSTELNAKSRYLKYSPRDAIGQARIDMTFLEIGGAEHKKTCGEIVAALANIFPDNIASGARRLDNIEDVCVYLRRELDFARESGKYDGWADRVPAMQALPVAVAAPATTGTTSTSGSQRSRPRGKRGKKKSGATAATVTISGPLTDSDNSDFRLG